MASDKLKDKLAEFQKKYPESQYVILSPFSILGDFMEKVFEISPEIFSFSPNPDDGDMYWVTDPKWQVTYQNGNKAEWRSAYKPTGNKYKNVKCIDKGHVGFHAAPLQDMANRAGISWLPYGRQFGTGRLDDGTDPRIVQFAAGGCLLGLSGMRPIIKSHKTDLNLEKKIKVADLMASKSTKKWTIGGKQMAWVDIPDDKKLVLAEQRAESSVLKMQRFAHEKAETKAQNRVIRSLLGIKQKYPVANLYYKKGKTKYPKKWVLLVLKFDPKPENEFEKRQYLNALTGTFVEAYPGMNYINGPDDAYLIPADSGGMRQLESGAEVVQDDDGGVEPDDDAGIDDVGESDVDDDGDDNDAGQESAGDDGGNEPDESDDNNGCGDQSSYLFGDLPPLYDPESKQGVFVASYHNTLKKKSIQDLLGIFAETASEYDVKSDPLEIKPLLDSGDRDQIEYALMKVFVENISARRKGK